MKKIIILGAGINSILSAYFLAKKGQEVIILEKSSQAAMGCSFANGGQLSFSHCDPWSSSISLLFKAFLKTNSFLNFEKLSNKEFFKWAFLFFKNSFPNKNKYIFEKILELGFFSKEILYKILREEKIDFSYKNEGILHFYKNDKLFNNSIKNSKKQKSLGCNLQILSAKECIIKEPTLSKLFDDNLLKGGIFYENDASGDCYAFTQGLKSICEDKLGVKFYFKTEVKNILTNYKKITGINTNNGVFIGDAYLNCLGAYSNSLLNGIKIDSKIYPIKGYSLSIPTDNLFLSPNLSLTDPENKIVYSKLGNIFRVAGMIEIGNEINNNFNEKNINFLKNIIRNSFSDFGDLNNAKEWYGFRPYRPDSLPLFCQVKKYGNLFLNMGHGSLGWTLSFATSKIVTDKILNYKLND